MTEQFRLLGLPFTRIDAVDAANLSASELARYDARSRQICNEPILANTEIGCFLSHRRAWERFLASDDKCCLVIEDDIEMARDVPELIKRLVSLAEWYDMVRFFGLRKRPAMKLCALGGGRNLVYPLAGPCGAQSYFLSRNGAEKLVRQSATFSQPVDIFIDRYWENGLKVLAIKPYPVAIHSVLSSQSTIGNERFVLEKDLRARMSWGEKIGRRRRKMGISLHKIIGYMRIIADSVRLRSRLRGY